MKSSIKYGQRKVKHPCTVLPYILAYRLCLCSSQSHHISPEQKAKGQAAATNSVATAFSIRYQFSVPAICHRLLSTTTSEKCLENLRLFLFPVPHSSFHRLQGSFWRPFPLLQKSRSGWWPPLLERYQKVRPPSAEDTSSDWLEIKLLFFPCGQMGCFTPSVTYSMLILHTGLACSDLVVLLVLFGMCTCKKSIISPRPMHLNATTETPSVHPASSLVSTAAETLTFLTALKKEKVYTTQCVICAHLPASWLRGSVQQEMSSCSKVCAGVPQPQPPALQSHQQHGGQLPPPSPDSGRRQPQNYRWESHRDLHTFVL